MTFICTTQGHDTWRGDRWSNSQLTFPLHVPAQLWGDSELPTLSYLSLVLKEPCGLWIKAEGLWSDFSASFRTYLRSNPLVTHCDRLGIYVYTRAKLPFFLLLHPKCCLLWLVVLSSNPSALLPYSQYVTRPRKPNRTTLVFQLEDLSLALIPLVAQTKTCVDHTTMMQTVRDYLRLGLLVSC